MDAELKGHVVKASGAVLALAGLAGCLWLTTAGNMYWQKLKRWYERRVAQVCCSYIACFPLGVRDSKTYHTAPPGSQQKKLKMKRQMHWWSPVYVLLCEHLLNSCNGSHHLLLTLTQLLAKSH
jgi:hypothetical protein